MTDDPTRRLRRLRRLPALRDLLAETCIGTNDLIAPLFVRAGSGVRREIASMPGQFQLSVDEAVRTVGQWVDLGIRAVLLFGIPDRKDASGSAAWDPAQPVQALAGELKRRWDDLIVVTDVCLCEYTDHGHCGPLTSDAAGRRVVDNDAAVELLARTAVSHAESGADIVAPSAMMDGQVAAIRRALDAAGFGDRAILSYAVKFASALYGPFRDAAESAPGFGDRRAYQMDYRAGRQAALEAAADAAEGADMLMVKPAGAYLDVLAGLRQRCDLPLAAYQVSGEYAMIKAAAAAGWLDEAAVVTESLTAIKRAGADLIVTYFAADVARALGQRDIGRRNP